MKKPTANVPYVPVVGFEKAIQAIKKSRVGDPLDKAALERRHVSGNTYYQVVNALKFLNIIDKNKRITDNLNMWLRGKEGRHKLVSVAYKPLLDKLKLPTKDNSAVKKAIKDQYKMADSVVLLATTFFTWAARQAGIDVLVGDEGGIPRRGRGAKPGLARRSPGRPPGGEAGRRMAAYSRWLKGFPPVVFNVNLQLSKDTKKQDIQRILSDLREELAKF